MQVKDKISSYDQVHLDKGLYDANAIKRVKPSANVQDTIENEALRQEALNTLTSIYASNGFTSAAMRIAKYMFVAVAWPPYAILIELPKWLFDKVQPQLLKLGLASKLFISKQIDQLVKLTLPILHFFQNTAKVVYAPIAYISHGFLKVYNKLSDGFSNLLNRLRSETGKRFSFSEVAEKLRDMGESLVGNLKRFMNSMQDPFIKLAEKMKSTFSDIASKITTSEIAQKIVEMPQAVINLMILPLVQQFTIKFERAQNLADQATKILTTALNKMVSPFSAAARLLYGPAARISNFIQSQLKRCFEFFQGKGQQFGSWIKSKAQILHPKNWIKKLFPPFLYMWIPEFIRVAILRLFRWIMAQPGVQVVLQAISKGWTAFLELPGNGIRLFVKGTESFYAHTKNILSLGWNQVASLFNFIGRILNRVVYWVLTTIIMGTIITGWGMKLLGRVTIHFGRLVKG